jgi:ADP-ribose pyrophosphatase
MDEHLREHCLSSQTLFTGHFLQAFKDTVRLPDGSVATREYVTHPGAVMVVPLLETEQGELRVVLERQFRYPVGRVMVEFPAGKLDAGESCWACARRELLEETGYTATLWARAGATYPVIGYSNEFIDIWFAKGLTAHAQQLDEGEFLEVSTSSVDELLRACASGQITDAKTLVGVLWLQNVRAGLWPLDWQTVPG